MPQVGLEVNRGLQCLRGAVRFTWVKLGLSSLHSLQESALNSLDGGKRLLLSFPQLQLIQLQVVDAFGQGGRPGGFCGGL